MVHDVECVKCCLQDQGYGSGQRDDTDECERGVAYDTHCTKGHKHDSEAAISQAFSLLLGRFSKISSLAVLTMKENQDGQVEDHHEERGSVVINDGHGQQKIDANRLVEEWSTLYGVGCQAIREDSLCNN